MIDLKIDSLVGNIAFNEENHLYWNVTTGEKFRSVTQLVELYKESFDADYMSLYKAVKTMMGHEFFDFRNKYERDSEGRWPGFLEDASKYLGEWEVQEAARTFRAQWKEASEAALVKGTFAHKLKEGELPVGKEVGINGSNYIVGVESKFHTTEKGVFPEQIIFNEKFMICGRTDLVTKDYKFIDINDYKTHKRIDMESYNDRERGRKMMKEPVAHLMDCHFSHISLQISLYAFMLEQQGYTPRVLTIEHLVEDTSKIIKVPYLRQEVENILNHYKNANTNTNRVTGDAGKKVWPS